METVGDNSVSLLTAFHCVLGNYHDTNSLVLLQVTRNVDTLTSVDKALCVSIAYVTNILFYNALTNKFIYNTPTLNNNNN